MRGRRRERLRVESRVHDTNLRSVGEQNRCQVGPTILFECPAQIPRSFLRSFSLWARHPAETSATIRMTLTRMTQQKSCQKRLTLSLRVVVVILPSVGPEGKTSYSY